MDAVARGTLSPGLPRIAACKLWLAALYAACKVDGGQARWALANQQVDTELEAGREVERTKRRPRSVCTCASGPLGVSRGARQPVARLGGQVSSGRR